MKMHSEQAYLLAKELFEAAFSSIKPSEEAYSWSLKMNMPLGMTFFQVLISSTATPPEYYRNKHRQFQIISPISQVSI